ncbi:hypothetical protein MNBD_GAMMA24-1628 [hydrothermal vent metagenome]|uniref:HAMP domain-containing protein n=1 Tax=hydrothermal vent metagenome TaxID=652676 RepID=A0A3B1BBZ3_9ZZZZ
MNHEENLEICTTDKDRHERLKQLAWIALLIGLAAAIVLGGLVYFLSAKGGTSYIEMINAHRLSRSHLVPALWVAGLFLLSLVALITGFIALYSSFRVAGPLYRFARNLSVSEKHSIIGIRQGDCLQDVSQQLQESIHTLDVYKQDIEASLGKAEAYLQSPDENAVVEYAALIKQLKAKLDGVSII